MIARLHNAVHKQPESVAPRQQPQARPQPAPQAPAAPAERGSRFGLGSLITRMSGGSHEAPAPHTRATPPVQAQAPAPRQTYDDDQTYRASQDRIEIPAFLRRQAN